MFLSIIPNELLLLLLVYLDSEADLASLARTNRSFYETLIPHLYHRNARRSQGSALLYAVQHSQVSATQKALDAGMDVHMRTPLPDERPLLSVAAQGGNPRLVQLLLDAASTEVAALDNQGHTPLFLAASHGHRPVVQLLLEHGADPNVADRGRRTPLHIASLRGHTAVVETLLAQATIRIDVYSNDGDTPLGAATRHGHAGVVAALLAHGAHAGLHRFRGSQVVIHSALVRGQPEILRLLVNRDDVDVNALFQNRTPLQVAVEANRDDLVEILLSDPRVHPDLSVLKTGQTPLLQAALKNNDRLVRLLLTAGANPRIMDRTWLSAAMILDAPDAAARAKLIRDRSLCHRNQG
ncbi:hypothetical protein FE257_000875 [Aspergillus nanangensis]|uniref:F-box domain-containing protein n=1 Tax=Aspergillus nanangensis TaxID=2582783 RepID=A0AAD4GQ09_ASPNN|nr:hypothetical protein FE257_000875 [Aspergillus nanangensis]